MLKELASAAEGSVVEAIVLFLILLTRLQRNIVVYPFIVIVHSNGQNFFSIVLANHKTV